MKYIVDVNGERVIVDLDGAQAVVDGETVAASLTAIEGTPVRLLRIGEQVHRLVARRGTARGRWTLDLDGQRVEAEAFDERMRLAFFHFKFKLWCGDALGQGLKHFRGIFTA